jgi:hypothetical protein
MVGENAGALRAGLGLRKGSLYRDSAGGRSMSVRFRETIGRRKRLPHLDLGSLLVIRGAILGIAGGAALEFRFVDGGKVALAIGQVEGERFLGSFWGGSSGGWWGSIGS